MFVATSMATTPSPVISATSSVSEHHIDPPAETQSLASASESSHLKTTTSSALLSTSTKNPVSSVSQATIAASASKHRASSDPSHLVEGQYIDPVIFASDHNIDTAPYFARSLCDLPEFYCKAVEPGDTWVGLWPDPHERSIVMRLNRTNVALAYRSWLVVPRHLAHARFIDFSPLPHFNKPTGHPYVVLNLGVFAFGAYDKTGRLVHWGPVTSGSHVCPNTTGQCETVTGDFHVYKIQGEQCISHTYPLETKGGAPMPYCMHFYQAYAMHASTLSGFEDRSQGCVRMFFDDAKWLNTQFVTKGMRVIVIA